MSFCNPSNLRKPFEPEFSTSRIAQTDTKTDTKMRMKIVRD
jgi:hypothetical protein